MVRGILIGLGLGLTGLLLFLGSGPLGELRPGMVGGRPFSGLAHHTPVAPNTVAEDEVGRQEPPATVAPPGAERKNPGETLSGMVREGTGQSSRLPVQIANLVKRQNLEIVIEKYAQQYGVDQDLVWAVIRQESGFNPRAVSPKGAMGLMQLMPGTAAMLGVTDAFDVEQNIAGGIKYLERCLNQFNQDVPLALAAYNAGPNNVLKYQGCPPFPETRQYVASVLKAYAGEPIPGDLKLIGFSPVIDQDVPDPDPVRPPGLAWRVPGPQWRIATPQCKLGSPRWKVTLLPF
jgi:Transglycosylase SLT domain